MNNEYQAISMNIQEYQCEEQNVVWIFRDVTLNEFFKTNFTCFRTIIALYKGLKNSIMKSIMSLPLGPFKMLIRTHLVLIVLLFPVNVSCTKMEKSTNTMLSFEIRKS